MHLGPRTELRKLFANVLSLLKAAPSTAQLAHSVRLTAHSPQSRRLSANRSERRATIVDPAKIGQLLRAIDSYQGAPMTVLALRLVPYLFPRPIEFRTIVIGLDTAHPEWRTPLATHENA